MSLEILRYFFFSCQAVYVIELYLKKEDYQTMAPKIIKYSQCCSRIAEEGRILCLNFFKEKKLIPWSAHIYTHTQELITKKPLY